MNPAAVIIIFIIIVLTILVIIFRGFFNNTSDLGHYGPEIKSECIGTDNCTKPGTQKIVQYCIPNPISGKGCIGPNGEQTFQSKITEKSCTTGCKKSEWMTETEPCLVDTSDTCVPSGTIGKKVIRLTCVSKDDVGYNACILAKENVPTVTSFGATGNLPKSVIYNVGETVIISELCSDYDTPICGDWFLVSPVKETVSDITLADTVVNCQMGTFMELRNDCNTTGNDPFNMLYEGWSSNSMTCVFEENGIRKGFTPGETSFPRCLKDCSSEIFDAEDVENETINIDTFDPVICGVENPECFTFCRYFPKSLSVGNGEFDNLLIRYLILRNSNVFVSSECVIENNCPLPSSNSNDIRLENLPLSDDEFNKSTLFILVPRAYVPGKLTASIQTIIGSSLTGWLSTEEIDGKLESYWKEARIIYEGPGISPLDVETYDITLDGSFIETQEQDLPRTMIGTQNITIKKNNKNIYSSDVVLKNIQAVVFNISTDLSTRI